VFVLACFVCVCVYVLVLVCVCVCVYSERFILVFEQARIRAEMTTFCGSRIFKRNINHVEMVAFAAHLKSTKITVFESVRKIILVNSQTTVWSSGIP